jgi:hypothetical protein
MGLGCYLADRSKLYIYVVVRNKEYNGEHTLQPKWISQS